MDEMRLKLSTNFMKGIAAKLIARSIYKRTGCRVNIQINDLDFWAIDGDTTVKLNVEARLNSDEFNKIIKGIDLED